MIEWILIVVLALIIVLQQGFYMWQVNKLLNKLMAGNYGQYVQAKTYSPSPPAMPNEIRVPVNDIDEDAKAMQEINSLLGVAG